MEREAEIIRWSGIWRNGHEVRVGVVMRYWLPIEGMKVTLLTFSTLLLFRVRITMLILLFRPHLRSL